MNSKEDLFHLGVKAVIHNSEGKILLLEKARSSGKTYWDLPGGRIKRGETTLQALERELAEEIGLQRISEAKAMSMHLTPIRIPQPEGDVGLILALYALEVAPDFIPQLSVEFTRYDWFSDVTDLLPIELSLTLMEQKV